MAPGRLLSLEVAWVVCGEGLLGIRLSSMGCVLRVLLVVGVFMGMPRLLSGLQMALVEVVLLVTSALLLRVGEGMLRDRLMGRACDSRRLGKAEQGMLMLLELLVLLQRVSVMQGCCTSWSSSRCSQSSWSARGGRAELR
jgi:hypothetical protein